MKAVRVVTEEKVYIRLIAVSAVIFSMLTVSASIVSFLPQLVTDQWAPLGAAFSVYPLRPTGNCTAVDRLMECQGSWTCLFSICEAATLSPDGIVGLRYQLRPSSASQCQTAALGTLLTKTPKGIVFLVLSIASVFAAVARCVVFWDTADNLQYEEEPDEVELDNLNPYDVAEEERRRDETRRLLARARDIGRIIAFGSLVAPNNAWLRCTLLLALEKVLVGALQVLSMWFFFNGHEDQPAGDVRNLLIAAPILWTLVFIVDIAQNIFILRRLKPGSLRA